MIYQRNNADSKSLKAFNKSKFGRMAIMNDNRDFKKRIRTVLRIYLENWMQKFSVSQADIAVDRFENEVDIRLKRVFKKGIPVLIGRINRFNEIYYYTGIEICTNPCYVWDDFWIRSISGPFSKYDPAAI